MFLVKRPGLPGEVQSFKFTGIDDDGISNLVGKVLTQLEAAIPEGAQLTALKSLVQQTIYGTLSHGSEMAYSIVDLWVLSENGSGSRDITVSDPWEGNPVVGRP